MVTVEEEIEIARPVQTVWDRIVDFARTPEWQPDLVEARLEGPNAVGARAREVRRFGAQQIEIESEMTLWEPPRHFRTEGVALPVRSTVDYRVEPTAAGCRVRVRLQLTGLPPVLERGVQRQTASGFAESLARLRGLLEGEPAPR